MPATSLIPSSAKINQNLPKIPESAKYNPETSSAISA
jgi:hypothetical protein